jgi:His/Glu/Gln/Arg/opine family amino acid ABC transporter permease subunit
MAATSQPRRDIPSIVHPDAPSKPAPRLSTGVWAWMRANLFRSTFDTIVTVITTIILVSVVVSFLTWAITQANWLVIIRNFRLFMVGTFPVDQLWRVNLGVLLVSFAVGFSMYAYLRIRRTFVAALLILLVSLVIVPILTPILFPPTISYFTAGNVDVASGTATETPQEQLAFIGRAGETITVQLAALSDDATLSAIAGFADRATAGLYNAANNRAELQTEIGIIESQLAGDVLTARQRAALTEERDGLTVPDPVSETYALNTLPVRVAILDGATFAVLAEATLDPALLTSDRDAPVQQLTFTLPADGWYILQKTIEGDGGDAEGVSVLTATGITPLIQRDLTTYQEYIRITDDYTVTGGRPELDERELPYVAVTDSAYRGSHTFGDYMRLYVAPFFELLARGLIPMAAVGAVGVGAAWGIIRVRPVPPRSASPKAAARALILPMWSVVLITFFVLIYGINGLTFGELMLIVASFIWVGWLFFAGMTIRRVYGRPLVGLLMVFGIIQQIMLNSGQPPLNVVIAAAVWLLIGYFALRQGVGAGYRFTPQQQTLGVVISGGLWGIFIALALAYLFSAGAIAGAAQTDANLLPVIETRRWGGLLLTMVLTVVAILASFPLGIGLALGRRTTAAVQIPLGGGNVVRLPFIKWVSTVYIELVRGVPLITVLFMAQLLVPLINPALANVENVIRAMVGLTLFSAAYLAENVRGGLQSVPHGQEEAARAVGLNTLQIILFITLPQALRAVIPALVGQCIALFKDTSLVALVGLLDLTGIAKSVTAQPEYVGLQTEAYIFIAVVYFIFSYIMAFISRRIEGSGSGAARHIG